MCIRDSFYRTEGSTTAFEYGYGYGYDTYNTMYGYGYYIDTDATGMYGFEGDDGKATSVSAARVGNGGFTVSYTTSYYAKNNVNYGTTNAACASLASGSSQTAFQTGANTLTISGLSCGTTYYYCVASEDAGGNAWYTDVSSISTGDCGGGGTGGGTVVTTQTTQTIATQTTAGTVSASTGGSVALTTTEGSKAEVVIPAAATTANLSVTVQSKAAATVEAAGTVGATPAALYRVGNLVFEVSASNVSSGAAVTTFSKDITLTFTYTDAQVAGLDESSLKIYTWNGTAWVALTSTVDAATNKVTATVNHLSYFSIMGQKTSTTTATTTTATTTVTITKPITQMTVSELKAKMKEVLALLINLVAQLIDELKNQLTAMIAGQQTGQTTATSTLTSLDVNLKYGDTGEAVRLLQIWLAKDKAIYPEGLVTGTFGIATKSAVIRFQEKYASEILTPVGLTKGTGLVGPTTRAMLNFLLGK